MYSLNTTSTGVSMVYNTNSIAAAASSGNNSILVGTSGPAVFSMQNTMYQQTLKQAANRPPSQLSHQPAAAYLLPPAQHQAGAASRQPVMPTFATGVAALWQQQQQQAVQPMPQLKPFWTRTGQEQIVTPNPSCTSIPGLKALNSQSLLASSSAGSHQHAAAAGLVGQSQPLCTFISIVPIPPVEPHHAVTTALNGDTSSLIQPAPALNLGIARQYNRTQGAPLLPCLNRQVARPACYTVTTGFSFAQQQAANAGSADAKLTPTALSSAFAGQLSSPANPSRTTAAAKATAPAATQAAGLAAAAVATAVQFYTPVKSPVTPPLNAEEPISTAFTPDSPVTGSPVIGNLHAPKAVAPSEIGADSPSTEGQQVLAVSDAEFDQFIESEPDRDKGFAQLGIADEARNLNDTMLAVDAAAVDAAAASIPSVPAQDAAVNSHSSHSKTNGDACQQLTAAAAPDSKSSGQHPFRGVGAQAAFTSQLSHTASHRAGPACQAGNGASALLAAIAITAPLAGTNHQVVDSTNEQLAGDFAAPVKDMICGAVSSTEKLLPISIAATPFEILHQNRDLGLQVLKQLELRSQLQQLAAAQAKKQKQQSLAASHIANAVLMVPAAGAGCKQGHSRSSNAAPINWDELKQQMQQQAQQCPNQRRQGMLKAMGQQKQQQQHQQASQLLVTFRRMLPLLQQQQQSIGGSALFGTGMQQIMQQQPGSLDAKVAAAAQRAVAAAGCDLRKRQLFSSSISDEIVSTLSGAHRNGSSSSTGSGAVAAASTGNPELAEADLDRLWKRARCGA